MTNRKLISIKKAHLQRHLTEWDLKFAVVDSFDKVIVRQIADSPEEEVYYIDAMHHSKETFKCLIFDFDGTLNEIEGYEWQSEYANEVLALANILFDGQVLLWSKFNAYKTLHLGKVNPVNFKTAITGAFLDDKYYDGLVKDITKAVKDSENLKGVVLVDDVKCVYPEDNHISMENGLFFALINAYFKIYGANNYSLSKLFKALDSTSFSDIFFQNIKETIVIYINISVNNRLNGIKDMNPDVSTQSVLIKEIVADSYKPDIDDASNY